MKKGDLIVSNLSWQPDKESRYILNNVSSEFIEGGFYGILGPNGSGKTSFIRHVLRLLETSSGEITLDKKNINDYSRKEIATNISFVPQNVNIDVNFNVFDIVAMGRTPYQGRFQALSKKDKEIIERAMQVTNCEYLREQPFSYLSGGESQRVLVARAIAQDTKYLILDEPISHLDIRYQIELMETLKRLNKEDDKTIIAILHDLNLCAAYCDNIILMKDGKVFAKGKKEHVLTRENLKAIYEIDFEVHKLKDRNETFFVPILNI